MNLWLLLISMTSSYLYKQSSIGEPLLQNGKSSSRMGLLLGVMEQAKMIHYFFEDHGSN